MILVLCGFVVFTTRRFKLNLTLLLVLMICPVLFSIVITSLEKERALTAQLEEHPLWMREDTGSKPDRAIPKALRWY